MKRSSYRLASLVAAGALLLSTLTVFSVTTSEVAHADSGVVACSGITCTVSTSVQNTGGWNDADHPGGSGSGSGGGSSPYRYVFTPCIAWVNVTSFQGSGSYPAQNSGRYTCSFNGHYSAGQGSSDYPSCAGRPDRAATGRYLRYFKETDGTLTYTGISSCTYPTDDYAPVYRQSGSGKVYTGGRVDFFNSHSNSSAASVFNGGGVSVSNSGYVTRSVDLNNPKPYVGSWGVSWNAQTQTINGAPVYGFYRLQTVLDYRTCVSYDMPSYLHQPTKYDCTSRGQDRSAAPYTYACNIGSPALRSGIIAGAKFDPSDCLSTQWTCSVAGQISIAGETVQATVMRDNKPLPTTLLTVNESHNGNVRNVQKQMYLDVDRNTVSPWNPAKSDANDPQQWFGSKDANGNVTLKFNQWQSYKQNGIVSFLWSSDNGKPWKMTETAQITAEFYVQTQNGMQWVADTGSCAGSDVSPLVSVVRSVNNG